jgi:hypothetical protein
MEKFTCGQLFLTGSEKCVFPEIRKKNSSVLEVSSEGNFLLFLSVYRVNNEQWTRSVYQGMALQP